VSTVVLRRIDTAQNIARFYRMDVQPDLFGGSGFIREWGRIGRPGTVRALPAPPRPRHPPRKPQTAVFVAPLPALRPDPASY
jgi:hypothetical protein